MAVETHKIILKQATLDDKLNNVPGEVIHHFPNGDIDQANFAGDRYQDVRDGTIEYARIIEESTNESVIIVEVNTSAK